MTNRRIVFTNRRFVFAGAALLLSALPPVAWAQQTEIVVYHYQNGSRGEAFKRIVKGFEEKNPDVKVTEVFKPDNSITADVQAALAARRPVDLATVIGIRVKYFAKSTPAVAIDGDPPKAKFLENYLPNFLEAGRHDGRVFALPYAFGTPMLYYNKDLFRQAGLDPENPPRTFADVIEAAKAIQARTGIAGYAHLHASSKVYGTMLMVTNAGGRYLDEKGERLLVDSPEGLRALQLWQDLTVKHQVMPIANDQQWGAAFLGGRLAMYSTSSAALRQYVEQTKGKFEIGVANHPLFDAATPRRVPNSGGTFMLYAPEGPKRDASLRFLAYLSEREVANQWSRESGYMPLVKDPLSDPAMRAYAESFPYVKPVIAQMSDTVATDRWAGGGALEAETIMSKLIDDLWAGRGTAAELAPAAVKRANEILSRPTP